MEQRTDRQAWAILVISVWKQGLLSRFLDHLVKLRIASGSVLVGVPTFVRPWSLERSLLLPRFPAHEKWCSSTVVFINVVTHGRCVLLRNRRESGKETRTTRAIARHAATTPIASKFENNRMTWRTATFNATGRIGAFFIWSIL
jgi:hypothetical protein